MGYLPVLFWAVSWWGGIGEKTYVDDVDGVLSVFGLATTVSSDVDISFWDEDVALGYGDLFEAVLRNQRCSVCST